jgi:hypothetical protein
MTQTQASVIAVPMLRRLSKLAKSSIAESAHEVGHYRPMTGFSLGADFINLATEISMCLFVPLEDMLHVFFEPAAAELLLRLPNRFWFWTVVHGAIANVAEEARDKPVPQAFVAQKLAEIRRIYAGKYNLQLALSDLSQSQVASRAVAGVLLVRSRSSELDEIVVNPIFAPCPGTEGTLAESAAALTAALLKT